MLPPGEIYKDKTVVVTGGKGFLGQHVCALLEKSGAKVVDLGREDGDLRVQTIGDNYGHIDLIIHLAAKIAGIVDNRKNPFLYMQDNTAINFNVVRFAMIHRIPIVAAGSVCVYSNTAMLPFREHDIFKDEPERSNYGYGLSKRYLLQILQTATVQHELFRYAYLNSANLYGPGDNYGNFAHVIPDLIKKADVASRTNHRMDVMGTGGQTRDFLYVEDAAAAFVYAGDYLFSEDRSLVCNIGSGYEVTIRDVATAICKEFGGDIKMVFDGDRARDGQPRRIVDSTLAKYHLGWKPGTGIYDGIKKTVADYCQSTS